MENIRYQEIARFSRGEVELRFAEVATLNWCGLTIDHELTAAQIARQFAFFRDRSNRYTARYLQSHSAPVAGQMSEAEAANLGEQGLVFLLPEVATLDPAHRLQGSVQFKEKSLLFVLHCVGQVWDLPILLAPDQPFRRETFRQHLSLKNASIDSMIDIKDGRNCALWIDFSGNFISRKQQKKRFGFW